MSAVDRDAAIVAAAQAFIDAHESVLRSMRETGHLHDEPMYRQQDAIHELKRALALPSAPAAREVVVCEGETRREAAAERDERIVAEAGPWWRFGGDPNVRPRNGLEPLTEYRAARAAARILNRLKKGKQRG